MFELKSSSQKPSEAVHAMFDRAPNPLSFLAVTPVTGRAKGQPLANGGATFPLPMRHESKIVDDLKESVSARWRLKSSVCKILRSEVQKEDGRSYAVCGCGHAATVSGLDGLQAVDSVRLFRREFGEKSSVSVSGTFRCNSPWLCPSCAPKRAKERRERLQEVFERADALGGTSAFVTLTVSHDLAMSLSAVKELLSTASRKARQGRRWKEIQNIGGVLGVIQGVEVLHNKRTGWHYHAHLMVPCTGTPSAVRKAMRSMIARYMIEVRKLGGRAKKIGQDVQIIADTEEDAIRVASYASKGSASWEIAGGLKSARSRTSRTPWDLVQLANAGDNSARDLFVEYSKAIVGTRSCVVSAALAKKLHMKPDLDEEAGEDFYEEDETPVVEIITDRWRKLMSYGVAWEVIQAVEKGKPTEVVKALVDEKIANIDWTESAEESRLKQRREEARRTGVNPVDLAEAIVFKRSLGLSWDKAQSAAISDVVRSMKMRGKVPVMPSAEEIGRAVSRHMEAVW